MIRTSNGHLIARPRGATLQQARRSKRSWARACAALAPLAVSAVALPLTPVPVFAQAQPLSADDAAVNTVNAARRAFNDRNYPAAADKFKEFLAANPNHREAGPAYYGLGLALLELPQRDDKTYAAAIDAFTKAGATGFADRALALYHLGAATRSAGNKATADAASKQGNESEQLKAAAAQRYAEAVKHFASAVAGLDERAKANKVGVPPAPAELPADVEWVALARCGQAEMLLRTAKYKEAADAAGAFQADPVLSRSKYRPLALYHLGYAQYSQRDYLAAGRALSQLAPFGQDFGVHARFLLARTHHLADERPEAATLYKAVLEGYEQQKATAKQKLQAPDKLSADEKAALTALANGAAPEYVVRAGFYGAVLLAEDARYPEAAERFAMLVQQQPKSPLATEAQLRLGYCKLQSKSYADAIKALEPLKDHAQFRDRALWWMARAQVGSADPTKGDAYRQALQAPMQLLVAAAAKAKELSQGPTADPDAAVRRGDILMELADTQQLARQYKEAAATYQQVVAENEKSDRVEEALQRRVTALHLGALYKESDALAEQFEQKFPKSPLLGAVWFRTAENAYLAALAAANDPNAKTPAPELERLFGVALTRYQRLVDKYPEFEYVDLARQAMATSHHRMGRYEQAATLLNAIPETSRNGDLATVPYLLADCLIRGFPPETDDALQANRLIDAAEKAAKLLEAFAQGQPKSPQAPDAMLKSGHCYQRMAAQYASAEERKKTLALAKAAYDKCAQLYPSDPVMPSVVFERAKCVATMGDAGTAANELRKFQADPLRTTPNAPLAMVRLSTLLRQQTQAPKAVEVMTKARSDYDAALAKDPARADWAPMLHYEHALALKESKKLPEARAMFEELAQKHAGKPDAINAVWRAAQCRREELTEALATARKNANKLGAKPDEVKAAYAAMAEPVKSLTQVADTLAATIAKQSPGAEPHLRALYELAWCRRALGQAEAEAARDKLRQDALEKVRAKLAKELNTQNPPVLAAPDVPAAAVPLQPNEKQAREVYHKVIAAGPASVVAAQARIELAELCAQRGEADDALDLLSGVLENSPPADLADRAKLRVAALLLTRNDGKSAVRQARPIAQNAKHPLNAEARYVVGESLLQQQNWPDAIEALAPFRDQEPLRNVEGVSDRALLRLGFAYAQAGQWEPSRQACEALAQRYPQSQWVDEAWYGQGWSLQKQKRYDEAANAYGQVTRRTAGEVAARAQLNVGLCRLEQKKHADAIKALLAVPYTYDYPQWSAAAWYEAGRAQAASEPALKEDAAKSWQRVVTDFPTSKWAPLAQQKLAELK